MDETILLKTADQISTGGLARGEIAIDEAARALVFDSGAIPLDVVALPVPTQDDIDEARVLVMGQAGPVYAPLVAGAGGIPLDGGPLRWTVPGILPIEVSANQTIASAWSAEIEISEPCKVQAIRTCPIGGIDTTITYGIKNLAGVALTTIVESSYAGPVDKLVDVDLEPGRYTLFMNVSDAVEFQVVRGFLPWARTNAYFPIYLRVDANAPA